MRQVYAAVLLLLVTMSSVHAGDSWSVLESVDSMTDAKLISAGVTNKSGHSLAVFRQRDQSIWMIFRIDDKSTDVLGRQLPIFRVDKEEPFDAEINRRMDRLSRELKKPQNSYSSEPKWVGFKIFHGEGVPDRGPLAILLRGKNIIVRYYLFTGGFKETEFTLNGAKDSITKAVGLPQS